MWNDLLNYFKYIYSSNVLLKMFRYLYFTWTFPLHSISKISTGLFTRQRRRCKNISVPIVELYKYLILFLFRICKKNSATASLKMHHVVLGRTFLSEEKNLRRLHFLMPKQTKNKQTLYFHNCTNKFTLKDNFILPHSVSIWRTLSPLQLQVVFYIVLL